MTQTTELKAIADVLRKHDRFLVVTHENPDGDALGSLLAAALALRHLGKDAVMYLPGTTPLPAEYDFMPLDDLVREALLFVPALRVGDDQAFGELAHGLLQHPLVVGQLEIDHGLDFIIWPSRRPWACQCRCRSPTASSSGRAPCNRP